MEKNKRKQQTNEKRCRKWTDHEVELFGVFFNWVFFHGHSRITGLQVKGEDISQLLPTNSIHYTDT